MACNIRNDSIYLKDNLVFGYFENIGNGFITDIARMAAGSTTQEWWKLAEPCLPTIPQSQTRRVAGRQARDLSHRLNLVNSSCPIFR